jgi:hypothetical protein
MANETYNKLKVKCSEYEVLKDLYDATNDHALLNFIKPEPDHFEPNWVLDPVVYVVDETMSRAEILNHKNSLLLCGMNLREPHPILPLSPFRECSYYIRGKMPGRKAYRTLSDNKLITPLEEKEYFEFPSVKNSAPNESWRAENWGTNGDIYQARLELNEPMLETSFKTIWQPPIEALQCLLEWDSIEDIKLAFHSVESGVMGTWINGKEDSREYHGYDSKCQNECSQMYDDLFSAEL